MSEGDLDKSDPASPYKLEKAREKGSVAKSQDVTFLIILLGLTGIVFGMGESLTRRLAALMHALLAQVSQPRQQSGEWFRLMEHVTTELAWIFAAPLAILMVLGVGAGLMQVGFTISAEPLKPDFNRLNPAEGFKRLFSFRSLYELARSLLKVGVVAILLMAAGGVVLKEILALPLRTPSGVLAYLIHQVGVTLAVLMAVLLLITIGDYAFTRWEFLRKMRMSKREIKDEHKNREGDPRIKARLRELRLEWLKKSMAMKNVPQSDVLITNPTHYAVAIAYKRGAMPAPKVMALGAGDLALRMRSVARQHHIPVVENPPLARSLYRLAETGGDLPQEHYAEVAKILVWVFAARAQRAQQQGYPQSLS